MIKQRRLGGFWTGMTALIVLATHILLSQQQQPQSLHFEVAAIKPANPKLGSYSSSSKGAAGGQFRVTNMPLRQWVEIGLSIDDFALKGPPWIDTTRFDLEAKLPADKPADASATADMMKTLLVERFGLKWHEETQRVAGYELVAGKNILIKPSGLLERLRGHGSGFGPAYIDGTNTQLIELAAALARVLKRPVVDATHLSGGFDFKLMWRPSDELLAAQEKRNGIDVDNLPSSVFDAIREQLGLRLQNANVPVAVIVVDSISSRPIEN